MHPQILPGHYVIKQNLFLLKTLYVYVCASRILRPSDLLPSLQLSRYRKLFHSSSSNSVIPVPYWPSGLRTRVWKTRKYPKPDPTRIFRVFWCLTCETWTFIEWNQAWSGPESWVWVFPRFSGIQCWTPYKQSELIKHDTYNFLTFSLDMHSLFIHYSVISLSVCSLASGWRWQKN